MTSHLPASNADPRAHPGHDRPDQPDQHTEETPDEMSSDGADPDCESSARLNAEIAAAAKSLFFAADLIRPGPGLLPFGAKARDRRERRREVDTIAVARRIELAELLATRRNSRPDRNVTTAPRGRPRTVAAVLTGLVIAVAAVGWLMSMTTTAAPPEDTADTGSVTTDLATYESEPTTPLMAADTAPQPAPAVDLAAPEAAAVSWMAAWCPLDPDRNAEALAASIRAVMTTDGWAQFTATPEPALVATAPRLTASCDRPTARVVSRPPGNGTTVVVLVSATRTITAPDNANATRRFQIEQRQYVIRGDDGLWRVDVPAVGG